MTKKEFYTIIANGNFDKELIEHATEQLEKMSIAAERAKVKRQSKPTKAQVANAPLREQLIVMLGEGPQTASAAAAVLGISVQKCSAILRGIAQDGICTVVDDKKGKIYKVEE